MIGILNIDPPHNYIAKDYSPKTKADLEQSEEELRNFQAKEIAEKCKKNIEYMRGKFSAVCIIDNYFYTSEKIYLFEGYEEMFNNIFSKPERKKWSNKEAKLFNNIIELSSEKGLKDREMLFCIDSESNMEQSNLYKTKSMFDDKIFYGEINQIFYKDDEPQDFWSIDLKEFIIQLGIVRHFKGELESSWYHNQDLGEKELTLNIFETTEKYLKLERIFESYMRQYKNSEKYTWSHLSGSN